MMEMVADDSAGRARLASLLAYHVLSLAWQHFGQGPQTLDNGQQHQIRQMALRQILIEDAVLSSREAVGVSVPRQRVAAALQAMREQAQGMSGGHQDGWSRVLKHNDLDEQSLDWMLARQMLVDLVMAKVTADLPAVTELDAQLYYYLHREEFQRPEKRRVRHILITHNDDYAENTRARAQVRMAAITERLRRRPQRFAEQALKHSECPSSLQGGMIGWVGRGELYPQLDQCLFQMQPGSLCQVESEMGWHLLWCEDVQPAQTLAVDEVLPDLLAQLRQRQIQHHQKRWVRMLLQDRDGNQMMVGAAGTEVGMTAARPPSLAVTASSTRHPENRAAG